MGPPPCRQDDQSRYFLATPRILQYNAKPFSTGGKRTNSISLHIGAIIYKLSTRKQTEKSPNIVWSLCGQSFVPCWSECAFRHQSSAIVRNGLYSRRRKPAGPASRNHSHFPHTCAILKRCRRKKVGAGFGKFCLQVYSCKAIHVTRWCWTGGPVGRDRSALATPPKPPPPTPRCYKDGPDRRLDTSSATADDKVCSENGRVSAVCSRPAESHWGDANQAGLRVVAPHITDTNCLGVLGVLHQRRCRSPPNILYLIPSI